MGFDLAAVRKDIAPHGDLRVAINLGNPVLAKIDERTGVFSGVSVALANALADELEISISLTAYDAAGKVFAALEDEAWDLAFLAIEPVRAEKISFSSPYVCIDGTYLVKTESKFQRASALDTGGRRIAVGKGAAYDLFLSRTLKNAELVRATTSAGAVDTFLELGLDAAAGVRQPLARFAKTTTGVRVLSDNFTEIRQAMAVPKGRAVAAQYVQNFINRCLQSGFVAKALDDSGERDARVAQPFVV
ncbi:transporter substrate-binding domain-containing protein [Pseudomonas coleopterorum]|uniref:Transporter substrate-binding domain-containing protein n=1 Tax=Pseudomonas coleopterorum TaxID=1605838 RepID=A0AAJ6MUQ7_9PSED|nr:transporter substrate-binding domain-containing protein [Pseudomonas coleopterorum]WNC10918.1 transporter substrate-binding domain-containing protein [Pseudomonas coleopterorum]